MSDINVDEIVAKSLDAFEARQDAKAQAAVDAEAMREEIRKEERTKLEKEVVTWKETKGETTVIDSKTLGSGGEKGDVAGFAHWMQSGDDIAARKSLDEADDEDRKALGESSGDGAYLVPDDNSDSIVELRDARAWPRLAGCEILQTNLPVVDIPAEDLASGVMTRTAEAGASASDDPSFAQNQVTVENWTTAVKISNQMLEDEQYSFLPYYERRVARYAANTEARYMAMGTGSSQHEGVFYGGDSDAVTLTATDANAIGADDIFTIFYALGEGYREGAVWLMNSTSEKIFRTTKSTSVYSLGDAGRAAEMIDGRLHLLGKPVFNQANIPNQGALNWVAFGNPDYAVVVERKGFVVARNPYLFMATGQTAFYTNMRQSGKITAEEAWVLARSTA